MALINDIYVFVETEDVTRDVEISNHPVEEGIDLTDYVRRSPLGLSLTGEIVGSDYEDNISELKRLQESGILIEYIGVNMISSALITQFSTTHDGGIRGGCRFSMGISEIRIASSPYSEGSGNNAEQQIEEEQKPAEETTTRTHTVKSGDTLWGLAKSYYGNGALYPRIFDANRDKLSDPNKIRTGQILTIP